MVRKTLETDSPLDSVERAGIRSASSVQLLAIAIATRSEDVGVCEPVALELIRRHGLYRLTTLARTDFAGQAGVCEFSALQALCAIELGRRAALAGRGEVVSITNARDVWEAFRYLRDAVQEHFCALFLDTKNGILAQRTIHVGTLDASLVGPREVFREAVREGASSIVVVHNHPSGDPEPSAEDLRVTEQLAEAGDLMGIPVLDHVIVGHHRYVSLKEMGLL